MRYTLGSGGEWRRSLLCKFSWFEQWVVSQLQSATIALCKREFRQLKESSQRLEVKLTRLPDRIEVVVSRHGLEMSRDAKERPEAIVGVDRIQQEIQVDVAITRLTKYVKETASGR